MLLSAISLSCLLIGQVAKAQTMTCPLLGSEPLEQMNKSNYVIDLFSNLMSFTYAIDQCTATSLVSTGFWYKYTCGKSNGVWSVTKTEYSDNNCTKSKKTIDDWTEGEIMEGNVGYFECTGENNYAKVNLSSNSTCTNSQVVYAGLGGCTSNGAMLTQFYCDQNQALIQLYLDLVSVNNATMSMSSSMSPEPLNVTCNPDLYCNKWTIAPGSCNLVANYLGQNIYGKMDSCVTGSSSVPTSTIPADNQVASTTAIKGTTTTTKQGTTTTTKQSTSTTGTNSSTTSTTGTSTSTTSTTSTTSNPATTSTTSKSSTTSTTSTTHSSVSSLFITTNLIFVFVVALSMF